MGGQAFDPAVRQTVAASGIVTVIMIAAIGFIIGIGNGSSGGIIGANEAARDIGFAVVVDAEYGTGDRQGLGRPEPLALFKDFDLCVRLVQAGLGLGVLVLVLVSVLVFIVIIIVVIVIVMVLMVVVVAMAVIIIVAVPKAFGLGRSGIEGGTSLIVRRRVFYGAPEADLVPMRNYGGPKLRL